MLNLSFLSGPIKNTHLADNGIPAGSCSSGSIIPNRF